MTQDLSYQYTYTPRMRRRVYVRAGDSMGYAGSLAKTEDQRPRKYTSFAVIDIQIHTQSISLSRIYYRSCMALTVLSPMTQYGVTPPVA